MRATRTQTPPVLLADVVGELKAVGIRPWPLQKLESAFIIRCERGLKQFRVALPPVNGDQINLTEEKTLTHVVTDIPSLREWLLSLAF